ncbi:MAG TPA: D-alanyl-D-alanine carboxypeptidase/D-alanyl-D-alanine-endopeptidase [Ferruginibacter sp.]|nr:D-alanyl-D-alanine carboxypeptidase/D-alanyl-D-alanine-endopeptidase [Ferruginibacter sp.]
MQSRLSAAMKGLGKDEQFKHASLSLYVVDSKTGRIIIDRNSQLGMAPASCQKVITSVTAFELLGKEYRYKTEFGYSGEIAGDHLKGSINFTGYGDPSFGSWRYSGNKQAAILDQVYTAVTEKLKIKSLDAVYIDNSRWGSQTMPRGWVWEDMGNYYGAGCSSFSWNENQYTIKLKPGKKEGDKVEIVTFIPYPGISMVNELTTGPRGSGDQAYIYSSPYASIGFIRGTVPAGEDSFFVSGSSTDGAYLFSNALLDKFEKAGITINQGAYSMFNAFMNNQPYSVFTPGKTLGVFYSPPFDSINYWFLKKSVNLYGEAFVKTMAYEKTGSGDTDTGISVIRKFWQEKGIERSALNMLDGSGLSPANRVTTHALVTVMQFARKQDWFTSFYNALPEMNGIKMKDGYISGVRSYTGYVKNKKGEEYTFSFIVNNFDGSAATVRQKMWQLLDILK